MFNPLPKKTGALERTNWACENLDTPDRVRYKERLKILNNFDIHCRRILRMNFTDREENKRRSLEKLMLHGKVEGRRARGRQPQTFMDSVSRFINTSNKSLSRHTEDREAWKFPIADVCARPGT
ncbi:endonuclease-reverse transcriptase [Elysia marginata]|uniref:Endonuclease-reverse transcriptase n=1 Tax=Elysia marginata TaxID=1093978 RepID=A0AAV4HXF3_9GAST|nr:endonuclease-reverse transcriptase [Elysia marginata]